MHRAACVLFAAFLGFAPSPSPGHQAPAAAAVAGEGIYQSRTMEVGSSLILSPGGRFLWAFSYGALDLA